MSRGLRYFARDPIHSYRFNALAATARRPLRLVPIAPVPRLSRSLERLLPGHDSSQPASLSPSLAAINSVVPPVGYRRTTQPSWYYDVATPPTRLGKADI